MASSTSVRGRRTSGIALLALGSALLGACGGGPPTLPPALASAQPSAASTAGPAPTVSAAPTPTPGVRTADDLRKALLTIDDVPSGLNVVKDSGEYPFTIDSDLPGCAALVALLNENHPPGAVADVDAAFEDGSSGPVFGETLDAFPEAGRVVAAVRDFRNAVRDCDELELDDGSGPTAFDVAGASAPELGDERAAVRLSAQDGDLELDVVLVAVDTVLLGTTGIAAAPEDVEAFTEDAYDKLVNGHVSGGTGSGQPA